MREFVKSIEGSFDMERKRWNEWLRSHVEEVLPGIGIKEDQTILDFGCGAGLYAIPAARLVGRKGKVYALDKDSGALETLKESARNGELGNIETILSSDLSIGVEDETADIVLLYDVIHLIEGRKELFVEIYRVLKPDGIVSIYPMHVEKDKVLRQMRESRFSLKSEKFGGNILNFGKVIMSFAHTQ
jgi:ubiquinone/menaquinone biosynthesis C-methylase UbiE